MIIASLTVAKRLESATADIESLIQNLNIDVICLQETEIRTAAKPEFIENFEPIVHQNESGISRVVTYIKDSIVFKQITPRKFKDFPATIIRLKEIVIINYYNEFTQKSYTKEKIRLSKPQQATRLINFLKEASQINRKIIMLGDVNIDRVKPQANPTID